MHQYFMDNDVHISDGFQREDKSLNVFSGIASFVNKLFTHRTKGL